MHADPVRARRRPRRRGARRTSATSSMAAKRFSRSSAYDEGAAEARRARGRSAANTAMPGGDERLEQGVVDRPLLRLRAAVQVDHGGPGSGARGPVQPAGELQAVPGPQAPQLRAGQVLGLHDGRRGAARRAQLRPAGLDSGVAAPESRSISHTPRGSAQSSAVSSRVGAAGREPALVDHRPRQPQRRAAPGRTRGRAGVTRLRPPPTFQTRTTVEPSADRTRSDELALVVLGEDPRRRRRRPTAPRPARPAPGRRRCARRRSGRRATGTARRRSTPGPTEREGCGSPPASTTQSERAPRGPTRSSARSAAADTSSRVISGPVASTCRSGRGLDEQCRRLLARGLGRPAARPSADQPCQRPAARTAVARARAGREVRVGAVRAHQPHLRAGGAGRGGHARQPLVRRATSSPSARARAGRRRGRGRPRRADPDPRLAAAVGDEGRRGRRPGTATATSCRRRPRGRPGKVRGPGCSGHVRSR